MCGWGVGEDGRGGGCVMCMREKERESGDRAWVRLEREGRGGEGLEVGRGG